MRLSYLLITCMILLVMGVSYALPYTWSSTIPVEIVPLSHINNKNELEGYLSDPNIVLFYIDDNFTKNPKNWILYNLNISEVKPEKIPDYGNYTYIDKNNIVIIYPKKYVYLDNNGALVYNTPKEFNGSKYKIKHIPPEKYKIPTKLPDLNGYVYLDKNSVYVLYPKKYVCRGNDGALIYNPPKREENKYSGEYKLIYNSGANKIPFYYNYSFVNKNNIFIIYPKKYVYLDNNGALLYHPPIELPKKEKIYNISTKLLDGEKGIYEIKNKKLLIVHPISINDKSILDFIGYYVSKNNGTFVYINKVPPHYKHVLINGIVIQNAIPDKRGDYAIDVAGRKIKVNLRNDDLINKKIKTVKGLSEILNINTTYISTGSENLKIIKKENPSKSELNTLLNDYWFKKWYNKNYTHIYYSPSNIKNRYNIKDFDILAMSYYPIIYTDKAPETFQNDPVGGYYPKSICYKGTNNIGYWEKGVKSDNKYYHYDKNEPQWNDNNKYVSNWYYKGKVVLPSNDSEMSDKYKYFNHWFVKNYGYALSENINGLLLTSNDKNLVDAIFGRDNSNLSWKLDLTNKIDYIVIPDHKEISKENGMIIIKIPGLLNDTYGIHYIKEYYIPPKDEEFGVYVADVVDYNSSLIYKLKDNYTWICSFKNYADWVNNYMHSNIKIVNGTMIIAKSNNPIKITIYKKGINISSLNLSNISIEEYNKTSNKLILYHCPTEKPIIYLLN
ncbi:hypothetical protein [Methanothermococcus sp.]|uniref:hypothetical protein n=1 Tax=Methanothermococcus sp. TaxID=2614238 RepID=UPI0025F21886|nr:hypothetical protein [Methanothermococcus sp.]